MLITLGGLKKVGKLPVGCPNLGKATNEATRDLGCENGHFSRVLSPSVGAVALPIIVMTVSFLAD
jgi:hypothetical protein